MDFPKSVPGVGLVDGKFVDENQATGQVGSLIPSKWGNDVTTELLGVIDEGGLVPDEENPQQLRAAVLAIVDKVAPVATKAEAETNDEDTANNVKRMTPLRVLQAIKARLINATETVVGMLRVGTQAEVNAAALDSVAVTPLKLKGVRMRRITRVASAALQTISGATTGPVSFSPLNVSFEADGGLYFILAKLQMNVDATSMNGNNYVAARLVSGATPLDISAFNIGGSLFTGYAATLQWSGVLSGPVSLSVQFEKTSTAGSIAINGDLDNATSNDSGQLSCIEVYRMGV